MYRQSKKNLLSSNTSFRCPYNMMNFGPLVAGILSLVWGIQVISTVFASWQRYCTASSSGRQSHFAALDRGRHLCSAGRPSRWALAHILVTIVFAAASSGTHSGVKTDLNGRRIHYERRVCRRTGFHHHADVVAMLLNNTMRLKRVAVK